VGRGGEARLEGLVGGWINDVFGRGIFRIVSSSNWDGGLYVVLVRSMYSYEGMY